MKQRKPKTKRPACANCGKHPQLPPPCNVCKQCAKTGLLGVWRHGER